MTARRSRLGRFLAAVFIRGGEAPFILRDLDDAFTHDVARGLEPAQVRRRAVAAFSEHCDQWPSEKNAS